MKDTIIKLAATKTIGTKVDKFEDESQNLTGDIKTIISNVILVLGLVAVAIIIVGGVSYMTSGGDTGKVKKAKDTILYGVIGLVICVLAFAIVNWVIGSLLAEG